MNSPESAQHSSLVATRDVLLIVVSLVIVLTPLVSISNSLLGTSLPESTVRFVVGILAVGGSYSFVAGGWSLTPFVEFAFAFVVCAIGAGALGFAGIILLGLDISGSNPLPQIVVFAVAYPLAYLFTYREWFQKRASADGDVDG